jgi:hypothetical protein
MGTALSLVLFALGAVLAFAVRAEPSGLDLTAVGVILMLVSAVGFGFGVYRERWRQQIVEESMEQGATPLVPHDSTVLVDPSAPIEAPVHDVVRHAREHVVVEHETVPNSQPVVNVNVEGDRAGEPPNDRAGEPSR